MVAERDVRDTDAVDEAARVDRDAVEQGRDGGPQNDDDMRAADNLKPDREVSRNYEESLEHGANQQGEGRVP